MTPQSKTIILILGFHILSILTEGLDYQDPECYKVLPPDCLDTFNHEMCEDATASVDISDKCCGFFIFTLNAGCYFYQLVKQVVDKHLCDDKQAAVRGEIIWDKCYGSPML